VHCFLRIHRFAAAVYCYFLEIAQSDYSWKHSTAPMKGKPVEQL